mmetsp:Transcript_22570/g.33656  ORF Transcript_22570/g.33656 Transcript_22570/m.33656 type:complete len:233 (-) Transcript_22570:382-1080(-)
MLIGPMLNPSLRVKLKLQHQYQGVKKRMMNGMSIGIPLIKLLRQKISMLRIAKRRATGIHSATNLHLLKRNRMVPLRVEIYFPYWKGLQWIHRNHPWTDMSVMINLVRRFHPNQVLRDHHQGFLTLSRLPLLLQITVHGERNHHKLPRLLQLKDGVSILNKECMLAKCKDTISIRLNTLKLLTLSNSNRYTCNSNSKNNRGCNNDYKHSSIAKVGTLPVRVLLQDLKLLLGA